MEPSREPVLMLGAEQVCGPLLPLYEGSVRKL